MSQISVVHYNPAIGAAASGGSTGHALPTGTGGHKPPADQQHHRSLIVLRQATDYRHDKKLPDNNILITAKHRSTKKTSTSTVPSGKDGGGAKVAPPIAVARRNARERNRVKQVNNGFANLRQHIPSFVAQAFEGSGRNKKLSKVETLRMAVEYIRRLEEVLGFTASNSSDPNHSAHELTSSDNSHSTTQFSFDDDDSISTTSTPPPQQLIRINTTDNTYEIITDDAFENAENLDPLNLQNLPEVDFHQQVYLHHQVDHHVGGAHTTTGSLSPGMYSEESLSPIVDKKEHVIDFSTGANILFAEGKGHVVEVKEEPEIGAVDSSVPILMLKTENELPDAQKGLVDDVMNWWESEHYTTS